MLTDQIDPAANNLPLLAAEQSKPERSQTSDANRKDDFRKLASSLMNAAPVENAIEETLPTTEEQAEIAIGAIPAITAQQAFVATNLTPTSQPDGPLTQSSLESQDADLQELRLPVERIPVESTPDEPNAFAGTDTKIRQDQIFDQKVDQNIDGDDLIQLDSAKQMTAATATLDFQQSKTNLIERPAPNIKKSKNTPPLPDAPRDPTGDFAKSLSNIAEPQGNPIDSNVEPPVVTEPTEVKSLATEFAQQPNNRSLSLKLDSPELGSVQIQVSEQGNFRARIVTESERAFQVISSALPGPSQPIIEAGIPNSEFSLDSNASQGDLAGENSEFERGQFDDPQSTPREDLAERFQRRPLPQFRTRNNLNQESTLGKLNVLV